jgi:hypothetical protein
VRGFRAESERKGKRLVATGPTRRLLLAAAAGGSLGLAGCLAGCKGITALGPVPKTAPDVVVLEHAIAAEQALVDVYLRAMRQLSAGTATGGARVVASIHAEHEAHLRQLRTRLVLPPRLAKTKIAPSRGGPPLPADGAGITGALVALERAAVARLTSELITAPPALAQLMASISASEAAHVVFLRRARSA